MKTLVWFLFGVAGGFVVAHFMNKDPRGHEILADVDARITEFTDRIADAYREQEARFSGLVEGAKGAAAETVADAKAAASDVADSASETARKPTD